MTTADGCVHIAVTTRLDLLLANLFRLIKTVAKYCEIRTHRRRDWVQQLRRVGVSVGGVYWALEIQLALQGLAACML